MMDEVLYEVNEAYYLHIQETDECVDYTLYQKDTWELMDGGVLPMCVSGIDVAVLTEVLEMHDILLGTAKKQSLEMLDQLYA